MASRKARKPSIAIARSEHERLTKLAEAFAVRTPEVSDELLTELERARVVDDAKIPGDVVRMGSSLRYTSDLGEDRSVTLVYPGDADIAAGRISIMTPIGAALIGLSPGQSIDWRARDGRVHRLTVQKVAQTALESPA
ncbi:nucleoside diphosphate kinase regulator [Rhizobium sp. S163]|uniref:nucleoside diphosphate kinase regulator n=1 Tax=Rhizobium sp. S163 TaxID=3055039 RepID=UPI0025A98793|nr:nucleoside diphosphate kinase regulator [Rhizobium sp. S163]MDM9644822.1 nucleoside diphosphate kinase regulator [Rhizobium sp. S163]